MELAERAAQAFVEPFALSRAEVTVSASIGIAVTNRSSDRAASLLQDADAAMYRAKRRGGARHELFDEAMHTQAVSRLLTERALRRALDRDELRVLFQPEFDLATGERVALEALLRWEHPVRGLVVPGDFLRVAEETGMIVPMGAWVVAQACERGARRTARQRGASARPCRSTCRPASCSGPTSPSSSLAPRARPGSTPTTLCLEMSESALLEDLDSTADALRALEAARRAARHRRLRHRWLVAHVPPSLPVRQAQDRPHVRGGSRAQRGRRRDRRRHHRHGPRARHGGRAPRASRPRSSDCGSSTSAATARRATTSAPPRRSPHPVLVLVRQQPA